MTTTGATVIVGLDDLPRGALLWRGMVTWIGGIGVILLAMILLPVLNIGGMQLLRNADFNTLGKIMPRAKSIAFSIGAVYLVLTLACALGYVWAGMSGFDAIVARHVRRSPPAAWPTTTAPSPTSARRRSRSPPSSCCSARMSFIRFVQFARGEPRALLRDSQIRAFLAIYAAFALGAARRAPAERRRRSTSWRSARCCSTSPRSSPPPASPPPTTRSGGRWPR